MPQQTTYEYATAVIADSAALTALNKLGSQGWHVIKIDDPTSITPRVAWLERSTTK